MDDDDDDDEEEFGGMFENGHWSWDADGQVLVFISTLPPKVEETPAAAAAAVALPSGALQFRDNVDLIEQIRFRRRYQRKIKPGQPDVITIQDVKDVALFTAPPALLSVMLVNILHTPAAERFMRALIFYMQFYLQTAELMRVRCLELLTKLRQPVCEVKENAIREDLSELRLLVANEYGCMILGAGDLRRYHHMGPHKSRRSLTEKDAHLHESLLRFAVQIVWLALGRKSFSVIELEVSRVFRSARFNAVEHARTGRAAASAAPGEAAPDANTERVLRGVCDVVEGKLHQHSPLYHELRCHEPDFRILALALLGFPERDARLTYLEVALAAPESVLVPTGVPLGVVGLQRGQFDTMLAEIRAPTKESDKSRSSVSSVGASRVLSSKSVGQQSSKSVGSAKKSGASVKPYADIVIPRPTPGSYVPKTFPREPPPYPPRHCSEVQRRRWLRRARRAER